MIIWSLIVFEPMFGIFYFHSEIHETQCQISPDLITMIREASLIVDKR